MSIFQAVILGLVQGIAEFLPISSSAHLFLVPKIFGWNDFPLVFDTSLHIGTMLAVLIYFAKDFISLNRKTIVYLIAGSLPIMVTGLLFGDAIEALITVKTSIIFISLGTLIMLVSEFLVKRIPKNQITVKRTVIIGLAQVLSLFSGVSRSGITISTGILSGLTREDAARFSFLLSSPAVFAAAAYQLLKSYRDIEVIGATPFIVGILTSFISGIICMDLLIRFLKTKSLWPFIIYRIALVAFLVFLFI